MAVRLLPLSTVGKTLIENLCVVLAHCLACCFSPPPQDYIFTEGDLVFQPGEKRKEVQVPLLELTEIDAFLHNRQQKQFIVDLIDPRLGAKVGKYPQTVVTIDDPGEFGNL